MGHVWITGAHGFIGQYLARHLADRGYTVAGIGHGAWLSSEAAQWGISSWINGDITAGNLGQMAHALGVPDVIFHLAGGSSVGAALANPQEDFMRTVGSASQLFEWVRLQAPSVRVVAISSAAVYGAGHTGKIPEDAHLTPFSPYGAHKMMMETLAGSYGANFGLQIALPRLFSVYGSGLKKQLLWDMCGKFAAGGTVELGGSGDELRDWTDVRDVVNALECTAALASVTAPVLNIATAVATPVREIAASVASHWEVERPADKVLFNGRSRSGDPHSLVADISRMSALGIECSMSVAQGIAEYVAWYKTAVMEKK